MRRGSTTEHARAALIAVALVGALAGCDGVFGLTPLPPLPPDAVRDGPADIAVDAPQCAMPFVHDSFDDSPACGKWGAAYGDDTGTTATVANGELVIQPGPGGDSTNSHGGCAEIGESSFASGFFIEVTTLPAGYEYLQVNLSFGSSNLAIGWNSTTIFVSQDSLVVGKRLFDPTQTTWVRVRPASDRQSIIAETAPDGLTWQAFGVEFIPAPDTIRIGIVGGVFAAPMGMPAPILVAGMNQCP
jgi:hypothetical protein